MRGDKDCYGRPIAWHVIYVIHDMKFDLEIVMQILRLDNFCKFDI